MPRLAVSMHIHVGDADDVETGVKFCCHVITVLGTDDAPAMMVRGEQWWVKKTLKEQVNLAMEKMREELGEGVLIVGDQPSDDR